MSNHNENIHIAILGPVSAGKSTLLNSLFANTFSDMKRKKTTMLPQIYQTSSDSKLIESSEDILKKNRESNEYILKLRESGQYNDSHFNEIKYNVEPIADFIKIPDTQSTYSILDMPGLNCSGDGNKIYYDYLEKISHKIDIYVLVFDVNSALNTTDEENILKQVNKYIEKNKHGYVHILINKCDEVEFETNENYNFTDDEIEELFNRCIEISKKNLKDIRGEITISPICTSELYVYRGAINNINTLEEKQLDNIIKVEAGKKQYQDLNKSGLDAKRKFVRGLINDKKSNLKSDWMKDTGYELFKQSMNNILKNYNEIILYHIEQDIDILLQTTLTMLDIDNITFELTKIKNRLNNLNILNDNKCKITELMSESMKTKLNQITERVNQYICNYVTNSNISGIKSKKSIDTIEPINNVIAQITNMFNKIKSLFISNPIESSQKLLKQTRIEIMNNILNNHFDETIFTELYNNKELSIGQFTGSVCNILTKDSMINVECMKKIFSITCNDSQFNEKILQKILSHDELLFGSLSEFKDVIIIVANVTNNNQGYLIQFIDKYFESIRNNQPTIISYYSYWINLNMSNICTQNTHIKYIYYHILANLNSKHNSLEKLETIDFEQFNVMQNEMDEFFMVLKSLYVQQSVDILKVKTSKKNDSNKSQDVKINNEVDVEVENEFHDAIDINIENNVENNVENNIEENSDVYNDSDDSDTVYKKTIKNAKVRTIRRINSKSKSK